MARRRYLSTQISIDVAVNKLAMRGGDFAVLLYTWMIPHASDDATLSGDPEELMFTVMPGRRDKEPSDIVSALELMVEVGLICWDGNTVRFPTNAFYKHQSYIKDGERRGTNNTADCRTSTDGSADQRNSAQTSASLKSSSSVLSSVKPSGRETPPNPPTPKAIKPDPKPKPKQPTYPADFEQFWNAYPSGRSSRPETFPFWEAMSEEDRFAAMAAIPAFRAGKDWIEGFHKGAHLWLKHRRWESPPEPMRGPPSTATKDRPSQNGRVGLSLDELRQIGEGAAHEQSRDRENSFNPRLRMVK